MTAADGIRARHLAWHEDDETLAAWPERDPGESMENYIVRVDVTALLDDHAALAAHIVRNGIRWCACSLADRMNDRAQSHCPYHGTPMRQQVNAAQAHVAEVSRLLASESARVSQLTARLAAVEARLADGEASDGHHTHNELYEYRLLYNAHAAHGWHAVGIPVVKSWRHSDGEECFGGGWFIVVATLPTGQVSNHYKAEHWDLFQVSEVDLPPEYDGHTPADAAARLRAALAAPTDTTKEQS